MKRWLPVVVLVALASNATAQQQQRLGPIEIESEHSSLGIGFGTQLRATVDHDDGGTDGIAELRRARLFLRGRFLDDTLRFRLQVDLAPRALELIDLFMEWAPSVVLRAGIAKIPFTRHWDQSFLRIPFVDWPLTERYFGGGRQLGLTLLDHRTDWRWAVGIYNGETARPANGDRFPRIYGLPTVNYLDLRNHTAMGAPHPEMVGRVSYEHGASYLALSAAWDVRPEHAQDETLRVAIDARLTVGELRLWLGGFLSVSEQVDGSHMGALGGSLLEIAWRVHPYIELALRHANAIHTHALMSDVARFGESQVAQVDTTEQAEEAARYARLAATRGELETVAALGVSFAEDDAKLTLDVGWLRTMGLGIDRARARIQIQLAF